MVGWLISDQKKNLIWQLKNESGSGWLVYLRLEQKTGSDNGGPWEWQANDISMLEYMNEKGGGKGEVGYRDAPAFTNEDYCYYRH